MLNVEFINTVSGVAARINGDVTNVAVASYIGDDDRYLGRESAKVAAFLNGCRDYESDLVIALLDVGARKDFGLNVKAREFVYSLPHGRPAQTPSRPHSPQPLHHSPLLPPKGPVTEPEKKKDIMDITRSFC